MSTMRGIAQSNPNYHLDRAYTTAFSEMEIAQGQMLRIGNANTDREVNGVPPEGPTNNQAFADMAGDSWRELGPHQWEGKGKSPEK